MKRLLITGASGYIGSWILMHFLSLGYDISILIRKESILKNVTLTESKLSIFFYDETLESVLSAFKNKQYDAVIHLAAFCVAEHDSTQVDLLLNANIRFGLYILEAMSKSNCRNFINTGTIWQHYNESEYDPVCLYAATKKAFEDLAYYYHKANHFNVINLILYDTYGPNDSRKKLLYYLKEATYSKFSISMSEGYQEIDMVYITDIANAYKKAIDLIIKKSNFFKSYAVKTGQVKKIREVANIYEKISKLKLNIEWGARPYRKREVMKISNNIEILPEWIPKYTLEDGLKKIILSEN